MSLTHSSEHSSETKASEATSCAMGKATQIKITLTRSLLGYPQKQRRVAYALGLRKTQRSVLQYDTPIIRGMINKIPHLLTVEVA